MRFAAAALFFASVFTSALFAQERDYLSADEIDQVREAQDPNDRLVLYIKFAQERLGILEQILAKEKPGRAAFIHDTIEDYSKIIDAIDTVADDALKRKVDLSKGMAVVASAEKDMAARLKKIEDSEPKDIARYRFVLQNAIETTQDSADLSAEDLSTRATEVVAKDKKEQQELNSLKGTKEVAQEKAADQKTEGDKPKRKPPTLLRKGETLDNANKPPQ